MATMVVQLGLATIPLEMLSQRLGVDLGDHQRHLRVHPPGRRVVDDDRAGCREAGRDLPRRRRAGRAQGDVDAGEVGRGGVLDRDLAAAPRQEAARRAGARRRTGRRRAGRRARPAPTASPCRPGRSRRTPRRASANSRRARSGPRTATPARRPGARARTACSTSASRTTQEMRMVEVEIISMLMPSVARVSNMVAVDPRVGLHARPRSARPGRSSRPS